jgi:hypothetical protein
MGLFASKEKKAAESAALQAEFERVDAMSRPDFAAEVMARGFGPGGPGEKTEIKINALYDMYAPIKTAFGVDYTPRFKIEDLLKNAAAALEQAGLLTVREGGEDGGNLQYVKTREGQLSLDADDVASRIE